MSNASTHKQLLNTQTGQKKPPDTSQRAHALFPESRVNTDHEVSEVNFDGNVRALRAKPDSSPKRPSKLTLKTCDTILKSLKRNEFDFVMRVEGNGFEINVGGKDRKADDVAQRIEAL